MTPDEAAAVLGVGLDADEAEIDRAYRRLARELHPDRYIGEPAADVSAASERFVDVTQARDVLLRYAALRAHSAAGAMGGQGAGRAADSRHRVMRHPPPDAAASAGPPAPLSWWLLATWTLLLVVGGFFVISGGPLWTPFDVWARVGLLMAFAIATALSGRRWVWRVALVLIGVNAAVTVVDTTVPGLLGLGFMIVASFGLAVQAGLVRFPDQ